MEDAESTGVEQVVAAVYDGHADFLYRLACYASGSDAVAQDVVVEVVVQACTGPGLPAGCADEGELRLVLARRVVELCRERHPPGARAPVGVVVAVCLLAGCRRSEAALVLGVSPADIPVLLSKDLTALAGPPAQRRGVRT